MSVRPSVQAHARAPTDVISGRAAHAQRWINNNMADGGSLTIRALFPSNAALCETGTAGRKLKQEARTQNIFYICILRLMVLVTYVATEF